MNDSVKDSDFYFGLMLLMYALDNKFLAFVSAFAFLICIFSRSK